MDPRIPCGMDVRRFGWGPEDEARAEVIVARHGGMLRVVRVGDAGAGVEWSDNGLTVTATGPTYAAALRDISQRLEA